MPESNNIMVKFAPSIKFIVAVYIVELVVAFMMVSYLILRGTP